MLKRIKKDIVITSLITLLPIVIGLVFWNKLPNSMPIHFNAEGVVDGWASKIFSVVGVPFILLATQLICVVVTALDPKAENNKDKIIKMVCWIVPIMSLMVNGMIYMYALGIKINVGFITNVFIGLVFVLVGNYLPKVKRNYTIGIKVPWTLEDDVVWDKTHRMSGVLWIVGGMILIVNVWINSTILLFIDIIAMSLIPIIYSFVIYKKKRENIDTISGKKDIIDEEIINDNIIDEDRENKNSK